MLVSIRDLTGAEVCAGAVSGRELLSRLLSLTAREPEHPTVAVLNFDGVEVATASFLRESVIAFRNFVRGHRSNYYPVLTNMNHVIIEELEGILLARGDAMMAGQCDPGGKLLSVALLGRLEPKQQRIFDLIADRREVDAGQLHRELGEVDGVKQTSWNNRLSSLAAAGLVFEISEGRSKKYKPIFEGA